MSFRVSDRASRAESLPPVSCTTTQKTSKINKIFHRKWEILMTVTFAAVTEEVVPAGPQADFTAAADEEETNSPASASRAASAED